MLSYNVILNSFKCHLYGYTANYLEESTVEFLGYFCLWCFVVVLMNRDG